MRDFESGNSAAPSSPSLDEEGIPTKGPVENESENMSTQTDPELAASPDQANSPEPDTISQAFANSLAAMVSKPSTKEPPDALKAVYAAGKYKADLTLDILVIQSFMAGLYLGMASHLYLAIGGGVLGAVFFPTSLIAVLLTSAELFTGDALIFVAAVLGGQVSIRSLCRNWTISWICNMAGCLAWAYFLVYLPDSLKDVEKEEYAIEVALKKAHQPWGTIFLKGIGGNFMVCLGVWQSSCAEDVSGKVLAMSFPIAGFVIIGFDNIIANQFFIPVGMMLGADISISHLLFRALLPATLGTLVGGGFVIGGVYWYVFDSVDTITYLRERIRYGRRKPAIDSRSPAFTPSTSTSVQDIDVDNGQSSSRRFPDLSRRFRRQTSTPISL